LVSTFTDSPQCLHMNAKSSSIIEAALGAPQCGQIVRAPILGGRNKRVAERSRISGLSEAAYDDGG
jgi:hypothetical protein